MTSGCKEHNLGDGEGTSPHRQCGRCSRKHGCRRRSCGRRFRNPVRAEIHPDLQGDRVGVGFGTAATPAPAGDIRSRSRSRSNGCARWSCCHTWLSRKSRRHDPARAVPSTGAKQPEPTRADAKRPSLGDARTPPTTAVLAGLRLLAARGLLLFLRLCWCGGRLRGAKRFRSLGRHLLLLWLRGLLSMPFYVAAGAPSTAGTLNPIPWGSETLFSLNRTAWLAGRYLRPSPTPEVVRGLVVRLVALCRLVQLLVLVSRSEPRRSSRSSCSGMS